MSKVLLDGYACIPYTHDHKSIEIKDSWQISKNVENMYFVTATFSEDGKPYFPSRANHYLLAKFTHDTTMAKELEKHHHDKTAFIFNMDDEFFEREADGIMNFVSVYYLEHPKSDDDMSDLALSVSKNDRIKKASAGSMTIYSVAPPKFTFPYSNSIVILEVSSQKSHQSVNKYCEQTRRNVCRKGIPMINLVGFSILEKLK